MTETQALIDFLLGSLIALVLMVAFLLGYLWSTRIKK